MSDHSSCRHGGLTEAEELASIRRLHKTELDLNAKEPKAKEPAKKERKAKDTKDTKDEKTEDEAPVKPWEPGHFHYIGCPLDTKELYLTPCPACDTRREAHRNLLRTLSSQSGAELGPEIADDY